MRSTVVRFALSLLATAAVAQTPPPESATGMNPLVDPFAANAKPAMPLPPPLKASTLSQAPVPLPPVAPHMATLPAGLHTILIRDNGIGLLGTADADAPSIPVAHARGVRIGEQDYYAEVSGSEIRLYTGPKGKLVWQGALGGSALVPLPVDLSQVKFIPPLSAGVNPGLRAGTASDTLIRKTGGQ